MRPERYSYSYNSRGGLGKSLKSRFLMVGLVLLALVLLVANARGREWVVDLRVVAHDWIAPIMETIAVPVRGFRDLMADKDALFRAYEENKQLREENETLKHWQSVALVLKAENTNLRDLAAYKPVERVRYVTAAVIAQSPEAYSGTLMINAGREQGVTSLLPVIDAQGLVGRVVELGETTAQVLLLQDPLSRVPVVTSKSRAQAILTGTGEELMRLTFVVGDAKAVELGEAVMTTSQGGLIPESVMVGTVFKRDANGALLVKPVRPLTQAEYVRVMVGE